jgi:hypothetical protein
MALLGYEFEKKRIEDKMAELRARLGKRGPEPNGRISAKRTRSRRVLSAEARERIAAAQRKRWAAQRKKAKKAGGEGA